MVWRQLHRWLGLVAGTLALVLGITGTLLALDPLRNAWQAAPAAQDLPVATLVQRVQASVPGAEEIRRLPSGDIVVYGFDAGQAKATRIDPASGQVLGWIDLTGLLSAADRTQRVDVLNGIAYDPATGRIFVTGKWWPKLFEIEIVP